MENILSNKGLTSSEANHITNVTKELVKDIESKTKILKLFTTKIIRDGQEYPNDNNTKIVNLKKLILRKGELYSLSAWLKSGVKYKEELLNEIENTNFILQEELKPQIKKNEVPSTSFGTYLGTLSIKDRNRYYTAESMAAHIGGFIHNFDGVRNALDNFSPVGFQKISETETVTVKNDLLYSKSEILNIFFDLQKEHREHEKVVNYFKSQYKDWVNKVENSWSDYIVDLNSQNNEIKLYNNTLEKNAIETFKKDIRSKKSEIANMKILIPNELQSILDEVLEYAKK